MHGSGASKAPSTGRGFCIACVHCSQCSNASYALTNSLGENLCCPMNDSPGRWNHELCGNRCCNTYNFDDRTGGCVGNAVSGTCVSGAQLVSLPCMAFRACRMLASALCCAPAQVHTTACWCVACVRMHGCSSVWDCCVPSAYCVLDRVAQGCAAHGATLHA